MNNQNVPFNLPVEYNVERDIIVDSSRLVNLYSIPSNTTISENFWLQASGYRNPVLIGSSEVRAQFIYRNIQYLVSGNEIYSRGSGGIITFIGSINSIGGYVGITANQTQVIFTDGTDAFVWDVNLNVFSTVVFPFSVTPVDIVMLDNYFILPDNNTQRFYISNLNDGLGWQALNFAFFQSKPDILVAAKVLKRRVYLFGEISTEVWFNSGSPDFPLRRENNALFEHGCYSPWTIKEGFEVMLYLARHKDGQAGVMMAQGSALPKKISSFSIDYLLTQLNDPSDSDAILYKENGLTFYQLNFTSDNITIVYVLETGRWHELSQKGGDRHPAISHSFYTNKHYIGIKDDPNIYELSSKFFTYNEDLIKGIMVSKPLFAKSNNLIKLGRFKLELGTGYYKINYFNQDSNEQLKDIIEKNKEAAILLSVSRNGGISFDKDKREFMGKYGDYKNYVYWKKLGIENGRRIVIKLEFNYKVPITIIGAYLEYEVLTS